MAADTKVTLELDITQVDPAKQIFRELVSFGEKQGLNLKEIERLAKSYITQLEREAKINESNNVVLKRKQEILQEARMYAGQMGFGKGEGALIAEEEGAGMTHLHEQKREARKQAREREEKRQQKELDRLTGKQTGDAVFDALLETKREEFEKETTRKGREKILGDIKTETGVFTDTQNKLIEDQRLRVEQMALSRQGTFIQRQREIEQMRLQLKKEEENLVARKGISGLDKANIIATQKTIDDKRTELNQQSQLLQDEQKEQARGSAVRRGIVGWAVQQAINTIHEKDPGMALGNIGSAAGMGLMMAGGPVGVAIGAVVSIGSAIFKELWQANREMHERGRVGAALWGRSPESQINEMARIGGFTGTIEKFGMNYLDIIESKANVSRARGIELPLVDALNSAILQKGGVLEQATISEIYRQQRLPGAERNIEQRVLSAAEVSGMITGREGDLTLTNELLMSLLEIDKKQLQQTGLQNTIMNEKIYGGLVRMLVGDNVDRNSIFSSPEQISRVMGALSGGLSNASTPQLEAFQYQTLSRLHPEESLWGLEKIRENPFGKGGGYLKGTLEGLQRMSSGNKDVFERHLHSVFGQYGMTKNMAEQFRIMYEKGDFKPEEITSKEDFQSLMTRVGEGISANETLEAYRKNLLLRGVAGKESEGMTWQQYQDALAMETTGGGSFSSTWGSSNYPTKVPKAKEQALERKRQAEKEGYDLSTEEGYMAWEKEGQRKKYEAMENDALMVEYLRVIANNTDSMASSSIMKEK
jgi:hypothetical protein